MRRIIPIVLAALAVLGLASAGSGAPEAVTVSDYNFRAPTRELPVRGRGYAVPARSAIRAAHGRLIACVPEGSLIIEADIDWRRWHRRTNGSLVQITAGTDDALTTLSRPDGDSRGGTLHLADVRTRCISAGVLSRVRHRTAYPRRWSFVLRSITVIDRNPPEIAFHSTYPRPKNGWFSLKQSGTTSIKSPSTVQEPGTLSVKVQWSTRDNRLPFATAPGRQGIMMDGAPLMDEPITGSYGGTYGGRQTTELTFTAANAGVHTLTAWRSADGWPLTTRDLIIQADPVPPVITDIQARLEGTTLITSWSATDAHSGIQHCRVLYRASGGWKTAAADLTTCAPGASTYAIPGARKGTYQTRIAARDNAGNWQVADGPDVVIP